MPYPKFNKKYRLISALSYVPITPINFIISIYSLTTRKDPYPRFHAIQSILMNLAISLLFLLIFLGLTAYYYPRIVDSMANGSLSEFLNWDSLSAKLSHFSGVFTILSAILTVLILIPIYSAYVGKEIRIAFIDKWAMEHC
jgi:uncharacterized membrane protein